MSSLPFMSQDEFAAACDAFMNVFLSRYDTEYSLRQSPYDKEQMYLVIRRNVQKEVTAAHITESIDEAQSENDKGSPISIELSEEDEDIEELRISDDEKDNHHSRYPTEATFDIDYHIVYSPIYKLPVLYFNVYPHSNNSHHGGRQVPLTSVDAVYGLIVPDHLEEELRGAGVTGGISQGMHPLLDVPFWFVHPCETAAIMRQWGNEVSLETYLSLWLGVVGRAVGLEFRLSECSLTANNDNKDEG